MNYYERIQQSIDYMEMHLEEDVSLCDCAYEAYMSIASFYRLFFSITGMNAKEYLRARRLSQALKDLKDHYGVLETAIKYGFQSADGFSRSFKKQFGILPSQVSEHNSYNESLVQERMNVMKDLFEEDASLEKYPDIKVIKDLESMKVACFSYFGKSPEEHAFEALKAWFQQQDISLKDSGYRLFGYNNPDPQEGATEYAYEYCITIPDELYEQLEDVPENMIGQTYPKVYRKILKGGKYAVVSVRPEGKEIGERIMEAWPRLIKWLENSKYLWGTNQYLEEHIGFSTEDDHIGGVDLYISIAEYKELLHNEIKIDTMKKQKLVIFREEGMNFEEINQKCWQRAIAFAKRNNLSDKDCKIYQYNQGFLHPSVLFNVVMIGLPIDFDIPTVDNKDYEIEMTDETKYAMLPSTWGEAEGKAFEAIVKWLRMNKIMPAEKQWLEDCEHEDFIPTGNITCLFPIQ